MAATITRQLLFQIEPYTRTKISERGENFFQMTVGETFYIGNNAIVSIEPVAFVAKSDRDGETFFLLTLSTGRGYYINSTTVQALITDTKGL